MCVWEVFYLKFLLCERICFWCSVLFAPNSKRNLLRAGNSVFVVEKRFFVVSCLLYTFLDTIQKYKNLSKCLFSFFSLFELEERRTVETHGRRLVNTKPIEFCLFVSILVSDDFCFHFWKFVERGIVVDLFAYV